MKEAQFRLLQFDQRGLHEALRLMVEQDRLKSARF